MPQPKLKIPRTKAGRLKQVILAAENAIRAKGWSVHLDNQDDESHRYATLEVSRGQYGSHPVEGLVELSVDEDMVKSRVHKTSFYGTGLDTLNEAVLAGLRQLPWLSKAPAKPPAAEVSVSSSLEQMLRRFDRFIRQLSRRYDGRSAFQVQDEYDLQDALHALLRCVADDVRPEEVVPSYAGASSRMDFLLKREGIVVEAKYASDKLRDKQIGEQLIVDIQRYQTHPDCKSLICVVYDPSGAIRNPAGLENDLSGKNKNLDVRVIVIPR